MPLWIYFDSLFCTNCLIRWWTISMEEIQLFCGKKLYHELNIQKFISKNSYIYIYIYIYKINLNRESEIFY